MKLTHPTKQSDIKRTWHLVDVNDKILGRISSEISTLLIGKGKPYYVPNLDCGDYVVVINAKGIKVTGDKANKKMYTRFSGYPGGLKKKSYAQLMETNPSKIIIESVSGMLPQNKLKKLMLSRLFIYADANHPYGKKFSGIK